MKAVKLMVLGLTLALLAACATQPPRNETLENARAAVQQAEQAPEVARHAPAELEEAREHLERAEAAAREREEHQTNHYAYLAQQHARMAQMNTRRALAQQSTEEADSERARLRLQAREQEVERFRQQAEDAQARLSEAEAQLADMEPRQTDRGLVLTLDEVQFEFDSAQLKAGAERSMERLARYLEANSDQNVLIEGHTDSVGDAQYNRQLSEERANTVRDALAQRGIDGSRIETRGLGEDYPVASNDSEAGRAENRRVEVIVASGTPRGREETIADEQQGQSSEGTTQERAGAGQSEPGMDEG